LGTEEQFLLWEFMSGFNLGTEGREFIHWEQRSGFSFWNKGEVILETEKRFILFLTVYRSNLSQKQAFRHLYFGLRLRGLYG
jgi:hypothetical protein